MANQSDRTPPNLASRQLTLALLTIAGLVAQRFPLPWSMAGLLFLVPAVVLGLRLVRDLTRAKVGGLLLVSTSLTLALAVVTTLMSAGRVAVYPAASGLERCMANAITEQAKTACQDEWVERAGNLFGPTGSPSR